jgi:hypothetical protein
MNASVGEAFCLRPLPLPKYLVLVTLMFRRYLVAYFSPCIRAFRGTFAWLLSVFGLEERDLVTADLLNPTCAWLSSREGASVSHTHEVSGDYTFLPFKRNCLPIQEIDH